MHSENLENIAFLNLQIGPANTRTHARTHVRTHTHTNLVSSAGILPQLP